MQNVSTFGTNVKVIALTSFPMGFSVNDFADDVDPIVAKETDPTAYELLYDGTMFAYDKASVIEVDLSVIAASPSDINLKIMLQTRKSTTNFLKMDITSLVISYPNGGTVSLSNGTILSGPLVDSVQTTGRTKGNTYKFVFSSFGGAQSAGQVVATIAKAALSFFGG